MSARRVDHQHHDGEPAGHDADALPQPDMSSRSPAPEDTEQAVLAVLAGTPPATAAAQIGLTTTDLADAVTLYQEAGRAALAAHAARDDWYQVHIEFPDWAAAENTMATHLWPQLHTAGADGVLSSWWYIRKAPCWRLRFRAGAADPIGMKRFLTGALDDLTSRRLVTRWWPSIYEPETVAFGGAEGIATAHRLFHADSGHILEHLGKATANSPTPTLGRRELSILLCTALMRSAHLDWHEQGDVWHRVTRMRPLPAGAPTDRRYPLAGKIRRLISLDTTEPSPPTRDDPLAFARAWLAAFTDAGHKLATAAQEGNLHRGLRDVLTHHLIFHWNRLGLTDRTQAVLAHAAVTAILNPSLAPNPDTDVAPT